MSAATARGRSFRIAAIYGVIGGLWILLSDRAIGWFAPDVAVLTWFQTVKGWFYIAVTAVLLFYLIFRQLRRLEREAAALHAADQDRIRALDQSMAAKREALAAADRLALATSSAGIGIWEHDLKSGHVWWDARTTALHALAAGGFGETRAAWEKLLVPEDLPKFRAALEAITTTGAGAVEFRIAPGDGSMRHVESHAILVRDTDGSPQRLLGTCRDVTTRREAERNLALSEARLRRAEEIARCGYWAINLDTGRWVFSAGARRIFGVGLKDMTLDEVRGIVLPAYLPRLDQGMRNLVEKGAPYDEEFKIARPDGSVIDVHSTAEHDAAQRMIFGVTYDVTERKRAEEQHRLGSAALAAAANAVAITDANGVIESINPAFTVLTGFSAAESEGRDLLGLLRPDPPDGALEREIRDATKGARVWRGERISRRKDGTLFTGEQTITPVFDAGGVVSHWIAIQQDATEKKLLQSQLLRNQRLESVGRLASGVAHDLNNILAPMLLAPPLLKRSITDPGARELLDLIENNALRGSAVIKQLLAFGRGTDGPRAPVQLRTLIREMGKIMRETFPKDIVLRSVVTADPWMVNGDATQLHQVLMNLCVNSSDAMPGGGSLTVALENIELDENFTRLNPGLKPGRHVVLGVSDTGTGIPAQYLDRVFDPFFTTKPLGKGTGLGLSTVLGIVKSHGGLVKAESRLGEGTHFKIYLPAIAGRESIDGTNDRAALPQGNGEMVLVVDDEEAVRRMTVRSLVSNGYRATEANDGAAALACHERNAGAIHVVLTDLAMPVLGGASLIRALRERDPRLRVIVASGNHVEALPSDLEQSVYAVLAKPFGTDVLLGALKRTLAPDARPVSRS